MDSTQIAFPDAARAPKELFLRVHVHVLNEELLRQTAIDRMSVSGFGEDDLNIDGDLGNMVFEALIGSNPDPVCPTQMGIEIVSWAGDIRPPIREPDSGPRPPTPYFHANTPSFHKTKETPVPAVRWDETWAYAVLGLMVLGVVTLLLMGMMV